MNGNTLPRRLARHFITFGAIVAVLVVGFVGWGATAPIASAAIASGQLSPAGLRMTVQHLEGGIVREILVEEGEEVTAGEPLILFDGTRPEANLEYDQTQMMRIEAMKARLEAHQAHADAVVFPDHIFEAASQDAEFAAFLVAQHNLFEGEQINLATQVGIYRAQLGQLEAEANGKRQEMLGADEQLALIGSELERFGSLLDQSLAYRSDLVELQRLDADYRSRRALAASSLAQTEQRISQVRLNITGAPAEFDRVVAEQLSTVNLQLAQLRERVRAGRDILDRTIVRAPVAGTVVGLRVNTPNAVVGAGQAVLDIVPVDASLVVNARLNPIDVDTVHVGLAVEIHVLSFAARTTVPISGRVSKVSADALTDTESGLTYYAVEIALDASTLKEQDREVLISGMPVEVFIFIGSRTFLEYMTSPIVSSFRRSFRDS